MRWLIVMLLASRAHADVEARLGMMLQGEGDQVFGGFEGAVERFTGRLSYGASVVAAISREQIDDSPLESAYLAGPTASWRLGATGTTGFWMDGHVRAGVDAGRLSDEDCAVWTVVPRVSLEGRVGDRRFSFVVAMGYARAYGGDDAHTPKLLIGGVDLRLGFGKRF